MLGALCSINFRPLRRKKRKRKTLVGDSSHGLLNNFTHVGGLTEDTLHEEHSNGQQKDKQLQAKVNRLKKQSCMWVEWLKAEGGGGA